MIKSTIGDMNPGFFVNVMDAVVAQTLEEIHQSEIEVDCRICSTVASTPRGRQTSCRRTAARV